MWVNWRKTKETTSFILKLCFFISKWKDQFAKRYWCCEVWRSEQGKTIYNSNHISKKCCLLCIPQKLLLRLVFVFVCFCFFLLCFCEKVLGNFGWFTCITLVIGFFYPLDCNLDLVKRKGAELTSKYFQMSNLNFCNNWCDVPWSWYV